MNLLFTSAGRRSYLIKYFMEALKGKGLIHAGNSELSPALVYADQSVITPLLYDKAYIEFLVDYCKLNDIRVIIPLFDIDLHVLSKQREMLLNKGIRVLVSDLSVIKVCNDKWNTYNFLKYKGIQTPKTYLNISDVYNDLHNDAIRFPLVIKPRYGMGSIGIYKAENEKELNILYAKSSNDVLCTYLKFESVKTQNKSVLIQEFLEGTEYGLDVINDLKCNYVTTLVKRKIAMRAGETDAAITEYNPRLELLGKNISENLQHLALLDVDCFITSEDEAYVLELNPRFGGHYPFSHLAGANIPGAIVKWLQGEVPDDNFFKIEYGIKGIKDINPIVMK